MAATATPEGSAEAKRVLFVRHAQGHHNATCNWALHDPDLTPLGEKQAAACGAALAASGALSGIEAVVVSPLTRTVRTTLLLGLPPTIPHLVTPLHRERWSAACDEGSSAETVLARCPGAAGWQGWDTAALAGQWWSTEPEDVAGRAAAFRRWLAARPESSLVVVGHGAFTEAVTGTHVDYAGAVWATVTGVDGEVTVIKTVHAGNLPKA